MKKLLHSAWLVPLLGTVLYLGTTYLLLNPKSFKVPPRAPAGGTNELGENPLASTHWDFSAPELDQLVRELKDEKERMAKKEADLNAYAARIAAERAELNSVTQEVYRLQEEFNKTVTYVSSQEAEIEKKQSKVFATMQPADAARVLEEMPDDRIVRLLMFMSDEEMANILSVLAKPGPENARRAAMLAERLRLSVQAPPAARSQSSTQPAKSAAGSSGSPADQLARLNKSAQPGTPADFHKLAQGYAAMAPDQAAMILRSLQDDQMAAILAEFTEEQTASFLAALAKSGQQGPQRAARVHELLLQKLNAGNS